MSNRKYEENEVSEMWADYKLQSQKKRECNRERAPRLLTEAGIYFECKNGGAHLIVAANGCTYDFWPGTGKYCKRGGPYRRGIFNLLKDIASNKLLIQ